MKLFTIISPLLIVGVTYAEDLEIDLSQFGTPIVIPAGPVDEDPPPETALDREISAFRTKHKAFNAVLINNSSGRALNKDGRLIGAEGLGRAVNPRDVMIIARASVADPVVDLYRSVKKLPACAHTVRILYTESQDQSESTLLGYTIENPKGVYTKLVKYDGKTPWLEWITKSFKKDDAQVQE